MKEGWKENFFLSHCRERGGEKEGWNGHTSKPPFFLFVLFPTSSRSDGCSSLPSRLRSI